MTSVRRRISPVRHWCSPGVLPFSHSSPFSSEAALQKSCRTSYPEKEEVKFRLCRTHPPSRSSWSRFSRSWIVGRRHRRKRRLCGLRSTRITLRIYCELVHRPGHGGEELPERKTNCLRSCHMRRHLVTNLWRDLSPSLGSLSRPSPVSSSPSSPC